MDLMVFPSLIFKIIIFYLQVRKKQLILSLWKTYCDAAGIDNDNDTFRETKLFMSLFL